MNTDKQLALFRQMFPKSADRAVQKVIYPRLKRLHFLALFFCQYRADLAIQLQPFHCQIRFSRGDLRGRGTDRGFVGAWRLNGFSQTNTRLMKDGNNAGKRAFLILQRSSDFFCLLVSKSKSFLYPFEDLPSKGPMAEAGLGGRTFKNDYPASKNCSGRYET